MSCSRANPRASTLLRWFAGLAVIAGWVSPSIAFAWTRAQVREVHARLELEVSGRAQVRLALAVEVEGGWLARLELPGLDERLALAQEPAWAVLESGERVAAQARLESGVLILHFARRVVRRGRHHVFVQYAADVAAQAEPRSGGFSRVRWTLPGWEAALSGAEIEVLGPRELRALVEPDAAAQVDTGMEGARRRVRFTRVHVPRASPWTIELELPAPASPAAAGGGQPGARRQPTVPAPRLSLPPPAGRRTTGLVLGTAIGLLVTWGRRRTRAWLAALGRRSRPLLTPFCLPWWAPGALCSLSGACWPWWPSVALLGWSALIAVGLERPGNPRSAPGLGRFEALGGPAFQALARSRARERSGLGSLDPASALGGSLLLATLALLAWVGAPFAGSDPWGLGALCALLAFVAGSRLWQPRSLAEQVQHLARAARRARVQGCALSLLWYAAGAARGQPRLRVLPRARYAGLLRLELLVDARRTAPALVLSALVESDSPAARWVPALWPDARCERSAGGARTAFLKPVAELSGPLEDLFEHLARESQRAVDGHARQERAA